MTRQIFVTFAAAASLTLAAVASAPTGYYSSLEGKSGVQLRDAARETVRKHTRVSYNSTSAWKVYEQGDTRMVDGTLCWWDMYSPNNVPVSSGHGSLNNEHSVPKSWWGGGSNDAYCDLFHLVPTNQQANSTRSNHPFGEVDKEASGSKYKTNGTYQYGYPVSGHGGGSQYVFEPADEYKGDFARIYFYMFTTYSASGDIPWASEGYMFKKSEPLLLKPWAVEMLLKWSRQDPVSEKEIKRNEAVYAAQNNRNPYVDMPELAEYVFGNKAGQSWSYDPSWQPDPTPDPNPDPTPDPTPDPDPNPGPIVTSGVWTPVTLTSELAAGYEYIFVAQTTDVAMSANVESTSKSKSHFKPAGTGSVVFSGSDVSSISADVAVLRLVPHADGTASVEVFSQAEGSLGYICSTTAKETKLSDHPLTGTYATFNHTAAGWQVKFGDAGNLCYNNSAPRFTTYTAAGQQLLRIYRRVAEPEELPQPEFFILDSSGEEVTDGHFSGECYVEIYYPSELGFKGHTFFYTLDGSEPQPALTRAASSTVEYSDVFTVSDNCTLKALAHHGGRLSPVRSIELVNDEVSTSVAEVDAAVSAVIAREGRITAPEGSLVFDVQGRRVASEGLASGIYIVVTPSATVKVMMP